MNRVRLLAIPLLTVLMGTMLLLPLSASAASSQTKRSRMTHTSINPVTNIPITGTTATSEGSTCTLNIKRFTVNDGKIIASGTLTDASGNIIETGDNLADILPMVNNGSCPILHLTLGPLDLNLLGLQVHLNRIVLDITAQRGPGNLLGNLLCAIAHLLDNLGKSEALNRFS